MTGVVFIALIDSPTAKKNIRLFIASLRRWGGSLAASPVWLFQDSPDVPCSDLTEDLVRVEPLNTPKEINSYPLGSKVFTCAHAEKMMNAGITTMIWCNPECLVAQPPDLLHLDNPFKAAFRPVHLQNVGIPVSKPLDGYWQRIYDAVHLRVTPGQAVQPFIGQQPIHPYYNTHVFSVDPRLGICRHWLEVFASLVRDTDFQRGTCNDEAHKVFLHQAVLSAVLLKEIGFEHIRLLPPTYSYPYHLQDRIAPNDRATVLNDIVLPVYEDDHPFDPEGKEIRIKEPFKGWLKEQVR